MNGGSRLLVDTNLLIFLLDGNHLATEMLQDKVLYYSFITEIELLGLFDITLPQKKFIEKFLSNLIKIGYSDKIEKTTIALKQKKKIKVPDAIIAATALVYDLPLITADKGFKSINELECILFEME
jgi:predicted nucleic acid-binding protein